MREKLKVIAYIFRNNRSEVLVFDHRDIPEAGTQVVGGTVEANEDFKFALSREIKEESGLDILPGEMTRIGETTYHRQDMPELNHRTYFEILSKGLPETWEHTVESSGLDNGMVFEFYWLPINEARDVLVGNFGELLP